MKLENDKFDFHGNSDTIEVFCQWGKTQEKRVENGHLIGPERVDKFRIEIDPYPRFKCLIDQALKRPPMDPLEVEGSRDLLNLNSHSLPRISLIYVIWG